MGCQYITTDIPFEYTILKKLLCNLHCLKARLRQLCNKLSAAQQPEPRFKTLNYVTFLFSEWRKDCPVHAIHCPDGKERGEGCFHPLESLRLIK